MKDQDRAPHEKTNSRSRPSGLLYLLFGLAVGAVAGVLLAPRSGEDTREWISAQCKTGIDTVNAKARQTRQNVGDWIDENKQQVTKAVSAGRDAYHKAKAS